MVNFSQPNQNRPTRCWNQPVYQSYFDHRRRYQYCLCVEAIFDSRKNCTASLMLLLLQVYYALQQHYKENMRISRKLLSDCYLLRPFLSIQCIWIDPLISFFRLSVSQSVCLLTDRLSNDYVHNSLPIFTKFCVRLRNVVASSPIVCETNRK